MTVQERLQSEIDKVEQFGGTPKFLVVPNSFEKEYLRAAGPMARLYTGGSERTSFNGLPMMASELAEKIHVF